MCAASLKPKLMLAEWIIEPVFVCQVVVRRIMDSRSNQEIDSLCVVSLSIAISHVVETYPNVFHCCTADYLPMPCVLVRTSPAYPSLRPAQGD